MPTSEAAAVDDEPLPSITVGMAALRRDNPWPELPEGVEPFYVSLDGGGRHLVVDVLRQHDVTLMVEIGCFLCGSTRQWLEAKPDLTVIGVDPWDGNWSVHIRMRAEEGNESMETLPDPQETADTLQRHGNFRLALNNIGDLRDRFVPVRQRSPEALHYLHRRGIEPQVIYIDAAKDEDELRVAHGLFPDAILCGDDWSWSDEHGRLRMQEHVERFAAEHGFSVEAFGATWVITKPDEWRRARLPWNGVAVERLLHEVDGLERDLLLRVAAATRESGPPPLKSIADELGASSSELLDAMSAINTTPVRARRKQVLGLAEVEAGTAFGMRPITLAGELVGLLPEPPRRRFRA
jgi:hypothetical protein